MLRKTEMGRVTVEFAIANNRDVVAILPRDKVLEQVKHVTLSGVVDSGAAKLVLPQRVVDELGLLSDGETTVRLADNSRVKRPVVSNVWLELLGRHGVFSAVVEPNREDALIGAIVLEELDLLVDCSVQSIYPREPDSTLTEVE
jgi:predicted aspartyl protease